MAKGKSSIIIDDNTKKNGLKNKSLKDSIKATKPLKNLPVDQKQSPVPSNNVTLKSLKKIQKNLGDLVSKREADKQLIKKLKEDSLNLSQRTNSLSETSKKLKKQAKNNLANNAELAHNTDLLRIKASLDKKSNQFDKDNKKLSKEIDLLKDLTQRVEHKIYSLEAKVQKNSEVTPSRKKIKKLNKNSKLLQKKVAYFEEALNQFTDTYIEPEQVLEQYPHQLSQLQQLMDDISGKYEIHDTQIKLLQTDAGNIRKSLQQEFKIHQKNVDRLQPELSNQTESIGNQSQQNELNKLSDSLGSLQTNVDEQKQALNQTDEKIAELTPQLEQVEEQRIELQVQADKQYQQFTDTISLLEDSQQQLIAPFEAHLNELEESIQSLQKEYTSQQELLSGDSEQFNMVNEKVNQFNDQLLQSQEELKQHIEQLHESDKQSGSQQIESFKETLEKLSDQLSWVREQSDKLLNDFNHLKEKQETDNGHHDELSKQYLTQQQQLEKHSEQFLELRPAVDLAKINEQQISQISEKLEQLADTQQTTSHVGNELQTHLLKLDEQYKDLKKHLRDIEEHQEKIVSYQQDQSSALNKRVNKIRTQGQLFSLGLITFLTVSSIILFTQQDTMLDTENEDALAEQQALISKVKEEVATDITNEIFSKINVLTKQNSQLINQEHEEVRNSIESNRQQQQQKQLSDPALDTHPLKLKR